MQVKKHKEYYQAFYQRRNWTPEKGDGLPKDREAATTAALAEKKWKLKRTHVFFGMVVVWNNVTEQGEVMGGSPKGCKWHRCSETWWGPWCHALERWLHGDDPALPLEIRIIRLHKKRSWTSFRGVILVTFLNCSAFLVSPFLPLLCRNLLFYFYFFLCSIFSVKVWEIL